MCIYGSVDYQDFLVKINHGEIPEIFANKNKTSERPGYSKGLRKGWNADEHFIGLLNREVWVEFFRFSFTLVQSLYTERFQGKNPNSYYWRTKN